MLKWKLGVSIFLVDFHFSPVLYETNTKQLVNKLVHMHNKCTPKHSWKIRKDPSVYSTPKLE